MSLKERFGDSPTEKGEATRNRINFLDDSEKLVLEHDIKSFIGDIIYSKLPSLMVYRSPEPILSEFAVAEIIPNAVVGESAVTSLDVYEFREDFEENEK